MAGALARRGRRARVPPRRAAGLGHPPRRLRRRGAPDRARRARLGVVSRAVEAAARQARRRLRPRCPRRHPAADRDARRDGGGRAVAGARHRRQHRDFLARQQPRPAHAAGQGPAAARDPHRPSRRTTMSWTYPIWRELRQRPQLFDSAFAWGAGALRPGQRRRRGIRGRDLDDGGHLRHARRLAGSRARVHRRRRSAWRRSGWTGRGHQSRVLAAAVRRRGGHDWPAADARADTLHDRRHHAAGLLRTGRRSPRRHRRADRDGDGPAGGSESRSARLVVALHHDAPAERAIGRAGHRGAARAAAADAKRHAAARLAGDRS